MKYLKIFEDQSYFTEIDEFSWKELCGLDIFYEEAKREFFELNWIDFTNEEISTIMDFFPDCENSILLKSLPEIKLIVPKSTLKIVPILYDKRLILNKRDCCEVTIVKLKDEWYYLCVQYILGKYGFYKCDQFDGLISLIHFLNPRYSHGYLDGPFHWL